MQCPSCGEPLAVWVDVTGGARQRYVEDCAVCCRPMAVHIELDEDGDPVRVGADARRMSLGRWWRSWTGRAPERRRRPWPASLVTSQAVLAGPLDRQALDALQRWPAAHGRRGRRRRARARDDRRRPGRARPRGRGGPRRAARPAPSAQGARQRRLSPRRVRHARRGRRRAVRPPVRHRSPARVPGDPARRAGLDRAPQPRRGRSRPHRRGAVARRGGASPVRVVRGRAPRPLAERPSARRVRCAAGPRS